MSVNTGSQTRNLSIEVLKYSLILLDHNCVFLRKLVSFSTQFGCMLVSIFSESPEAVVH